MSLNKNERLALKKFKTAIQEAVSDRLVEIKLFGSKARGDARKDSDVDVLVLVSSGNWRIVDIIYDIATDVLLEDGICISPKVLNKKEYVYLSNIESPFIRNIIKEGITI